MSSISITNDDRLINVLVPWVYFNVHFLQLAGWKCEFCSLINGSYYVNDFGCTCVGIRNICKDHFFLKL